MVIKKKFIIKIFNTNNSKKYIYTFLNYYLFTIINALISILSLGFITKLLEPNEYGYIGIYNSILFFIPSLVTFSNQSLQSIEIVRLDKYNYLDFRNKSLTFIIFNFIIFSPIVFFFITVYEKYLFVIVCSYVMAFLMSISNILNTELINDQKATKYGIFSTLTQIIILFISIVSLKYFHLSWHYRILSFLIAEILVLILRIFLFSDLIKKYRFEINDIFQFRTFYKYGIPLVLYVMIGWVLNQSDRYFLLKYFTLKEVGFYTIAASFSSLIIMINSNLIKVFTPIIYRKLKNNDYINNYYKMIFGFSIFLFIITTIYSLILKNFIPFFLSEKYIDSLEIIYLFNYSQLFFGIYSMSSIVVDFFKKNIQKTTIIIFSTIQIIILNILFIPYFGYLSPAFSMLITFLTLSIMMIFYSKYLLKNIKIE